MPIIRTTFESFASLPPLSISQAWENPYNAQKITDNAPTTYASKIALPQAEGAFLFNPSGFKIPGTRTTSIKIYSAGNFSSSSSYNSVTARMRLYIDNNFIELKSWKLTRNSWTKSVINIPEQYWGYDLSRIDYINQGTQMNGINCTCLLAYLFVELEYEDASIPILSGTNRAKKILCGTKPAIAILNGKKPIF